MAALPGALGELSRPPSPQARVSGVPAGAMPPSSPSAPRAQPSVSTVAPGEPHSLPQQSLESQSTYTHSHSHSTPPVTGSKVLMLARYKNVETILEKLFIDDAYVQWISK